MAEYCVNCWNKLNRCNVPAHRFILSNELELCEGCGQWTNVIVIERKFLYIHKLRTAFFRKHREK